jgi:hypothetical protein
LCPRQKILLAENWFLQAGNRAENTKEKSRQCFMIMVRALLLGHIYIYIYIFFFSSLFFVIWSGGICQIPTLYHGKK